MIFLNSTDLSDAIDTSVSQNNQVRMVSIQDHTNRQFILNFWMFKALVELCRDWEFELISWVKK